MNRVEKTIHQASEALRVTAQELEADRLRTRRRVGICPACGSPCVLNPQGHVVGRCLCDVEAALALAKVAGVDKAAEHYGLESVG